MKATKTETHDWVRLNLNDGKVKANLTWSRSRDTVSGNVLEDRKFGHELATAWTKYRDSKTIEGSLGKRLDIALNAAQTRNMAEFLAWLEENE